MAYARVQQFNSYNPQATAASARYQTTPSQRTGVFGIQPQGAVPSSVPPGAIGPSRPASAIPSSVPPVGGMGYGEMPEIPEFTGKSQAATDTFVDAGKKSLINTVTGLAMAPGIGEASAGQVGGALMGGTMAGIPAILAGMAINKLGGMAYGAGRLGLANHALTDAGTATKANPTAETGTALVDAMHNRQSAQQMRNAPLSQQIAHSLGVNRLKLPPYAINQPADGGGGGYQAPTGYGHNAVDPTAGTGRFSNENPAMGLSTSSGTGYGRGPADDAIAQAMAGEGVGMGGFPATPTRSAGRGVFDNSSGGFDSSGMSEGAAAMGGYDGDNSRGGLDGTGR